ncbi:Lrp/AsnC family transcriptional regulator [Granulosicoccus sp.]|nr:Lrp/AsnC family transcriptional regulator [Granulosicoccus sp.]MDB4222766.1 Lrp/AsnC family transcriptional regulator [Granulosicoccus sp.]
MTGELDAILIANFHDMDEYQNFCDRLFDGVDTIVRYTTYFATEIYMEDVGIQCKA